MLSFFELEQVSCLDVHMDWQLKSSQCFLVKIISNIQKSITTFCKDYVLHLEVIFVEKKK